MTTLSISDCVSFTRYTAALLLSVFVLFSGAIAAEPIRYTTPKEATVIPNKSANTPIILRSRPSFSSAKAGSVNRNTPIIVLAEHKQKERLPWYKIRLPNTTTEGWVYGQYLNIIDSATEKNSQPVSVTAPLIKTPQSSNADDNSVQPVFYQATPQKTSPVSTTANATEKPDKPSTATVFLDLSQAPRNAALGKEIALLKDAPGLHGNLIATLSPEQVVVIKGLARVKGQQYPWYSIVTQNQQNGWIYGEYIEIPLPAPDKKTNQDNTVVTEGYPKTVIVTTNHLVVRQTPSRAARKIGRKTLHDRLDIVAETNIRQEVWVKVKLPAQQEGWVLSTYTKPAPAVKASEPENTPPPAASRTEHQSRLPQNPDVTPPSHPPTSSDSAANEPIHQTAQVTRPSIHVRTLPTTHAPIITRLRKHQHVTIVDKKQTGDAYPWYQLASPNGWVYGQFVKLSATPATAAQPSDVQQPETARTSAQPTISAATEVVGRRLGTPKTVTITRESINVREKPSTNSPVISRLNKNQQVTIVAEKQTGESHLWYQLSSPDGWIYGQFVTFPDKPSTRQLTGQQSIIEPFTPPKPAKITGTAPRLRKSYSCHSPELAILTAADNRNVDVLALYRGREPYFWYRVNHPAHGVGWIYGSFLRFADENIRFPQIHLTLLDINAQYGASVAEVIQKLGEPVSQTTEKGRLKALSTDYQSIRLEYPGLTLRFLRYCDEDHLLEVTVTDPTHPVSTFTVGMNKVDVMLQLGETSIIRSPQGDTLNYIDPVSAHASLSFILNEKGKVVQIKKNAWID